MDEISQKKMNLNLSMKPMLFSQMGKKKHATINSVQQKEEIVDLVVWVVLTLVI